MKLNLVQGNYQEICIKPTGQFILVGFLLFLQFHALISLCL